MFKKLLSQHVEIGSFHIKLQISGISQKNEIWEHWAHITTVQWVAVWAAAAPFRQDVFVIGGPHQFLWLHNSEGISPHLRFLF